MKILTDTTLLYVLDTLLDRQQVLSDLIPDGKPDECAEFITLNNAVYELKQLEKGSK